MLREPGQQVDGGGQAHHLHILSTQGGPVITGLREDRAGAAGGTGEPELIPPCGRQCGNTASETPRWTLPPESAIDANEPPAEQVAGHAEGKKGDEVA